MAYDWTEERVAILKRMWAEGSSAAVIAAALGGGVSRSGVLGKVHRMRRELPTGERRAPKARPAARATPPPRPRPIFKHAPPPKPAAPRPVIRPEPVEGGTVKFLDRRMHHECAWPEWDNPVPPIDERMVCGRPVREGAGQYCEWHRFVSHGPGTRSERGATVLSSEAANA